MALAVVITVGVLCGAPQGAQGTIYAEETFDSYTTGQNLDGGSGGTGFSGNWKAYTGTTSPIAETKTLVSPVAAFKDGQGLAGRLQASVTDTNILAQRTLPALTATLYIGMLLRPENWSTDGGGDFIQFQVSNGNVGNDKETLSFGIEQTSKKFFARIGTATGSTGINVPTTIIASNDTTYLLVQKVSLDSGSQYGRVDLFVNPNSTTEPPTADATAITNVPSITQITLFNIRANAIESTDRIWIDNLRIASTFAEAASVRTAAGTLVYLR